MREEKIFNVIVGSDNGNSEHDIILNGHLVAQPNVYAKVSTLPIMDEMNPDFVANNIHDNLICNITSSAVNNGASGSYFVGKYALSSGRRVTNMEVGIYNNKADSDIVIVNTLAQIGAFVAKKAYLEGCLNDYIVANVEMTSSLPVKQYRKENYVKLANKFMEGSHKVEVFFGTVKIQVEIKFEYVKILPESVPVVFALQNYEKIFDNVKEYESLFREFSSMYDISLDPKYFSNKKILHIGIGEGTTEFPLTDNITFNPNFILGTDNGVGQATEAILPAFKEAARLRTFTRQNFSEIIKDKSHKYYDLAVQFLEDPLEAEAEEIVRLAKLEIEKANNDVDILLIHGGGSIIMKDYLYDKLLKLGEELQIKVFYIPEDFAVIMEAIGLFEFTKSPLFKALKEKNKKQNIS